MAHVVSSRLFVPLSSLPFWQFEQGYKEYELRHHGRQYTEKNVYAGRPVELRKGYSGKSLWGVIGEVRVGELEALLSAVDYRKVEPTTGGVKYAAMVNREQMGDAERWILFRIKLSLPSVDSSSSNAQSLNRGPFLL